MDADRVAADGQRLAVIGAGWAGLAAAVRAEQAGFDVTVFEMAPHAGGRARSLAFEGGSIDNGQHILIGAYRHCLALLQDLDAGLPEVLQRQALTLRFPDGRGLSLPAGASRLQLLRGLLQARGWSWVDRLSLLRHLLQWWVLGFTCAPALSVDRLCASMTRPLRELLIDPLCVAALNTPAHEASGRVFLRVLHDALLGPRGSGDLLLPKVPLSDLLPHHALAWLDHHEVSVRFTHRVGRLEASGPQWLLDGEHFDAVVLAASSLEAARLVETINAPWAVMARALDFESIVTVILRSTGSVLPAPMVALHEGPLEPAQFVFDHGALGLEPGRFVAVVSGANRWLERGLDPVAEAVRTQLVEAFAPGTWREPLHVVKAIAEKRATFRCAPALQRPPAVIAPGLFAAGDYVDGPYPATLEGAVRAGEAAVQRLQAVNSRSMMQKQASTAR